MRFMLISRQKLAFASLVTKAPPRGKPPILRNGVASVNGRCGDILRISDRKARQPAMPDSCIENRHSVDLPVDKMEKIASACRAAHSRLSIRRKSAWVSLLLLSPHRYLSTTLWQSGSDSKNVLPYGFVRTRGSKITTMPRSCCVRIKRPKPCFNFNTASGS